MMVLDMEQGTAEWHEARRCTITGTKLQHVMSKGSARRGLIAELIAEKETEQSKAFVKTHEMERGNAEEQFAINLFQKQTGKKVDQVGICKHDDLDWVALSPDGLIADKKGKYTEAIEVKCPDSKKAILYRIENMIPMEETGLCGAKGQPLAGAPFLGVPSDYKWQIVQYFLVNKDLEKLHFVTYDERFIRKGAKLYIVEVERKNEILQEAIKEAEDALEVFREQWLSWAEIVLPTEF